MAYNMGQLLFPPVCPGCKIYVAKPGDICPDCWTSMTFITRPYCEVLGLPFAYDIGVKALSAQAIAKPPPFAHARAVAHHQGLARHLVSALKYHDRLDLAPSMARLMVVAGQELWQDCDFIVPVPLHYSRFIKRHYNQAGELGRYIAKYSGRNFLPQALKRTRYTKQQVGLTAKARQKNVQGAFSVPPHYQPRIANKNILMIDDVYTTGATVYAATHALKHAGVARVDVLTFSRVI